jgi:hypothetical protein
MILAIIVIGLIIIFWLQMPFIKNDDSNSESNYKTIFNKIKIPIIFLCFVYIIYLYLNKPCVKSTNELNLLQIDNIGWS